MFGILKQCGYPVTEDNFPEEVTPTFPYIQYARIGIDKEDADNHESDRATEFQIFLHTQGKRRNKAAENVLESVLNSAVEAEDMFDWEFATQYYDEDEEHFVTVYEVSSYLI